MKITKDGSKKEKDPLLKWVVPLVYAVGLTLSILFLVNGLL